MHSIELLSSLEAVPLSRTHGRYTMQRVAKMSTDMLRDGRDMEVAIGAQRALEAIDAYTVPDNLQLAYKAGFPNVSAHETLREHYLQMVHAGPRQASGFVASLKGRLAESLVLDQLSEQHPGVHFAVATLQNQKTWDIAATAADGSDTFLQVKVGTANYASAVADSMHHHPTTIYAVTSEIRDQLVANHPDLAARIIDTGLSNYAIDGDVHEHLETLANHTGIHLPEAVEEILPYVGEIILGIRLLADIARVNRDYSAVKIDDKGRVCALRALALFSRFGVSTVCTAVGAAGGSLAGPWGTAAGAVGGAVVASWLNKTLRPYVLEIAMWLVRVDEDDLFYFRNKVGIDSVGASLARSAANLA